MQKVIGNKKFTFICEYKGGTYVSQCDAHDLEESIVTWLNDIDDTIFSIDVIKELKDRILNEIYIPQPLNGISNVWFNSYTIYDELVLLNIVLTSKECIS